MEELNHPVAVVAILAGIAVMLREIAWFVKTITGKTGQPRPADQTLEKVATTLDRMNTNLILLNERTERTANKVDQTHEAIIRGNK